MKRLLLLLPILSAAPAARAQLCTTSATGMVFGVYDPASPAPSDITGSVSVSCRAVTPVAVSYTIQFGAGSGGSIASRSMAGLQARLTYQIYSDAAHSAIWGDGTGGSGTVSDAYALSTLATVTRTYTAYGRIQPGQRIPPDAYTDLLTIMVMY